ncbi:MAG: aldose 1-epimerase family protein [Defluviitaleaceae bacterium]|nr:aldose 1-epimerase family protein [Defluviitaleaceae bacterium]MCL2274037.1 aldose 1-epimerase family protein [Defluviitaleaceae bacterium]MCL2274062.1 aldose 1-epimerase family protein [Defluviitaleaceae bacterium]
MNLHRYNNPAALYGARRVTVAHGAGKGQGLLEVKTAAGLRATFLEDKCLDILDLEYKGVNLGFLSKNGLVNQNHPEANTFTQYWQGGFLSTCGLRNVGAPCTVDGEFFPLHGRIGLTPAEPINISTTGETIVITGTMRESALFGHCLEMTRIVTISTHGAEMEIRDTVRNLTPEETPIFLLYHINFGYPFLNENLRTVFPKGTVCGRTEEAQARVNDHAKMTAPIDGEPEYVFFHTPESPRPTVLLENKVLGISAEISYDAAQLPVLAQWKCMRAGDYALGIEPSTSHIRGREEELANGYDVIIPAFGALQYGFSIKLK